MDDLREVILRNEYPGRIVGCARTGDGQVAGIYAVTGRSEASLRRRITVAGNGLAVVSTTDSERDPLRHYECAVTAGRWLVLGNGEQVRLTADRLDAGLEPPVALDNLSYEPDPPLFTARITVVLDRDAPGNVVLGAARRPGGGRSEADRMTLSARGLATGDAIVLCTYATSGGHVRTAPSHLEARVSAADAAELLDQVWSVLWPATRVAAVTAQLGQGGPDYLVRNA